MHCGVDGGATERKAKERVKGGRGMEIVFLVVYFNVNVIILFINKQKNNSFELNFWFQKSPKVIQITSFLLSNKYMSLCVLRRP